MVGISKGRGDDVPRIVPGKAVFVHQKTHHLRDSERGVRIVDMNGCLFGKQIERSVPAFVIIDNIFATMQTPRSTAVSGAEICPHDGRPQDKGLWK